MPPGTPFNSFALPYPIRVDGFSAIPSGSEPQNAALHLLSHTHSDHIVGLQAQSFSQTVYCSADAKQMLLHHEIYNERALHKEEYRAEHKWTFRHLKIDPWIGSNGQVNYQGSRDLLKPLPLNTPTVIELECNRKVTITLLDANHCPGSVMFLIEGQEGAILHTGDFRAEPWFLESIKRNAFLQPYLTPLTEDDASQDDENGVVKTLDAIYLDTACVMQTHPVPTKEDATTGLIALLKLYPPSTYFFINSWTWGYEDILKAIARAFNCKIHLDDYKAKIFSLVSSDPLLRSLGTTDEDETRFHACERFDRCPHVRVDREDDEDLEAASQDTITAANQMFFGSGTGGWSGPKTKNPEKASRKKIVVYINPVSSMTPERWVEYQATTRKQLINGKLVRSLLVPLSRHSPLPELQSFVSLFRPKRVIPNTLDPKLKNLDWAAIDGVFQSCCRKPTPTFGSKSSVARQIIPPTPVAEHLLFVEIVNECKSISEPTNLDEEEDDVAVKNLVGDISGDADIETRAMARKWLTRTGHGVEPSILKGRVGRRMDVLRSWLGLTKWDDGIKSSPVRPATFNTTKEKRKAEGEANGLALGRDQIRKAIRREPIVRRRNSSDNEFDSSDDEDDDRGRTAHHLFATSDEPGTQMRWEQSSFSFSFSDEDAAEVEESLTSNRVRVGSRIEPKNKIGGMTPKSSPMQASAARPGPDKGKGKAVRVSPTGDKQPHSPHVGKARFMTSTPNRKLDSGSQLSAEPFILSQSPKLLFAKGRSLHFSPSSPVVSPSKSPALQSSIARQRSLKFSDETINLSSPIHLVPSSPSSKFRSRTRSGDAKHTHVPTYAQKRQLSGKTGMTTSSSPPSSPLKSKKRGPEAIGVTHISIERPQKRLRETFIPSVVNSTKPLKEVKNIPERPTHHREKSITSSSTSSSQNACAVVGISSEKSAEPNGGKEAEFLSDSNSGSLVPVHSPPTSGSKSPARKRPCLSSHRSKSELLFMQLDYAQKAAKARPHRVLSTFEAKRVELESRAGTLKTKEINAIDYAAANIALRRRKADEFEKSLLDAPELTRGVEGVDWEQSRILQRRATEDIQNGRKPTFPRLQCVQSLSNDDL